MEIVFAGFSCGGKLSFDCDFSRNHFDDVLTVAYRFFAIAGGFILMRKGKREERANLKSELATFFDFSGTDNVLRHPSLKRFM